VSGGRAAWRALCLACVLLVAGCDDRTTWRDTEGAIVGWWVEDVAHGIPRRPDELTLVDGSAEQLKLARWAQGSDIYGTHVWPRVLAGRVSRHAELTSLASLGLIVRTPGGFLRPRPGITIDERDLVATLLATENADRRELDALVLSLTDAQEDASQAYLQAVSEARGQLDEAMGIHLALAKH